MGEDERRGWSTTSGKVLAGILVGLALIAVVIGLRVPRGQPPERITEPASGEAVAVAGAIEVDAVDAPTSTFKARLLFVPGEDVPDDGALVVTDIGALPTVAVRTDAIDPEHSVLVPARRGDISDYPFDRYEAELLFLVVDGADTPLDAIDERSSFGSIAIEGLASAPGFEVDGVALEEGATGQVRLTAERNLNVRMWAVGMMAIIWLLAAAAVGVVLSVLLQQRMWETRHFAWLASMLFALVAFRNTAPGSPPIGTFLDFYAFFPAVAIVALSLMAMVADYLLRSRRQLGL